MNDEKNLVRDNKIYLDYNATTPLDEEVKKKMKEALDKYWGNPSSSYYHGQIAKVALQKAREKIADILNIEDDSKIIFTSGGTEANNLAIHSAIKHSEVNSINKRPHVIISNVEHDAILNPIKHLAREEKLVYTKVTLYRSTEGFYNALEIKHIMNEIRPDTCLISIMTANNESGLIHDIEAISRELKSINKERIKQQLNPILLHTDAAQAIGKIPVNASCVDYMTIVGHKFYGPRGGCLYASGPVYPMFYGGPQQNHLRPGTEDVFTAVGLGAAAELVKNRLKDDMVHFRQLISSLKSKLEDAFLDRYRINFPTDDNNLLPNTLSVSFENVSGKKLLEKCKYLEASVGAACHGNDIKSSRILSEYDFNLTQEKGTIRLSVGRYTTEQDIINVVKDLKYAYDFLTKDIL